MDVTLRTAHLVLRPLHARDMGALIAGLNDYEVARYLTRVPYPYTEADAAEWLRRQKPAVPGLAVLVVDLPGVGFIGSVSLGDKLGYWLDRRYHCQGYMTEACEALLDWHFAHLPEDIVPSGAHVGNEASLRVQQKLGFVDTGERVMRFVRSQQREIEHVTTRLDRAAFAAARRNLRRA